MKGVSDHLIAGRCGLLSTLMDVPPSFNSQRVAHVEVFIPRIISRERVALDMIVRARKDELHGAGFQALHPLLHACHQSAQVVRITWLFDPRDGEAHEARPHDHIILCGPRAWLNIGYHGEASMQLIELETVASRQLGLIVLLELASILGGDLGSIGLVALSLRRTKRRLVNGGCHRLSLTTFQRAPHLGVDLVLRISRDVRPVLGLDARRAVASAVDALVCRIGPTKAEARLANGADVARLVNGAIDLDLAAMSTVSDGVVDCASDLGSQVRRQLCGSNGFQELEPRLAPYRVLEGRLQLVESKANLGGLKGLEVRQARAWFELSLGSQRI